MSILAERRAWLGRLKPGDEVILPGLHGPKIRTVDRLTERWIVLKNGERYRKKDGAKVGGSTHRVISEVTPGHRLEVERLELIQRLSDRHRASFETIPIERLRLAEAALDLNAPLQEIHLRFVEARRLLKRKEQ